jgi:hypothetical protein
MRRGLIAAWLACAASAAHAQSLSTVPHADVPEGERLFDYRAGFAFSGDGRDGAFGHRLHYQHSINGSWRVRAILIQAERPDGVLATQNLILHTHHQLIESEETGGFDSAIRFDGFIPIDDRPGRARVVWLNAIDFDRRWQARGDLFIAKEIGSRAADGFLIETRAELSYAAHEKVRIGAQVYDNYGTTAGFGPFSAQRHQVGAFVRMRATKKVGVELGGVFGVSRAAPDADIRMILSYAL